MHDEGLDSNGRGSAWPPHRTWKCTKCTHCDCNSHDCHCSDVCPLMLRYARNLCSLFLKPRTSRVMTEKTTKHNYQLVEAPPVTVQEQQLFDLPRAVNEFHCLGVVMRVAGGWVRDKV